MTEIGGNTCYFPQCQNLLKDSKFIRLRDFSDSSLLSNPTYLMAFPEIYSFLKRIGPLSIDFDGFRT